MCFMNRPVGNPEIEKNHFEQQYNWDEPCSAKLTLRLPPTLYGNLREIEKWQEKTRVAIANLIEEQQAIASEKPSTHRANGQTD